jgi:hypothetical protein
MDQDVTYAFYFNQGCRSARIGQSLTSNPFIDQEGTAWQAWADGFLSINLSNLAAAQRALLYFEGWSAAKVKVLPRHCPYPLQEGCEKVDLWMLGYMDADSEPGST